MKHDFAKPHLPHPTPPNPQKLDRSLKESQWWTLIDDNWTQHMNNKKNNMNNIIKDTNNLNNNNKQK